MKTLSSSSAAAAAMIETRAAKKRRLNEEELQVVQVQELELEEKEEGLVVVEEEEEDIGELLKAMGKKYLEILAKEALSNYRNDEDLTQRVLNLADEDPAQRSIFVFIRGETTTSILTSFFSKYGEVEGCDVRATWILNPCACGSVVFKSRSSAREALKNGCQKIGDTRAECMKSPDYKSPIPTVSSSTTTTSSSSELEELIEGFGKDYLEILLKDAISKHPDFIRSVRNQADSDPAPRTIIASGLSIGGAVSIAGKTLQSVSKDLIATFRGFGEIQDLAFTPGSAFILFKHRDSARKVLKVPDLVRVGDEFADCRRFDHTLSTPTQLHIGLSLAHYLHQY